MSTTNSHNRNQTIGFIVASYNEAASIAMTLRSIIDELGEHDELIIVDGASTDGTQNIIERITDGLPNILFVSEPDKGLYDAWNKAISMANSDWLAFVGCGDLLVKNYRRAMLDAAKQEGINFVHTNARVYEIQNGEHLPRQAFGRALNRKTFKKTMRVCHVGALHHISLFDDLKFSTNYGSVSDYHFLLQKFDSIRDTYVDEELVKIQAGGISTKPFAPYLEEVNMKKSLPGYSTFGLYLVMIEKIFRSQVSELVRKVYY